MLTTKQIAKLKSTNISVNTNKTALRTKNFWKALKPSRKKAVLGLLGLSEQSVYHAYTRGVISAKLALALAQVEDFNPQYLVGKTDESGEYSETVLLDFLLEYGYDALAGEISPQAEKTERPTTEAPVSAPEADEEPIKIYYKFVIKTEIRNSDVAEIVNFDKPVSQAELIEAHNEWANMHLDGWFYRCDEEGQRMENDDYELTNEADETNEFEEDVASQKEELSAEPPPREPVSAPAPEIAAAPAPSSARAVKLSEEDLRTLLHALFIRAEAGVAEAVARLETVQARLLG